MRAVVLVAVVVVQIVAGFGLMQLLDDFLDGGKICYYHWGEDDEEQQSEEDARLSNLKEQPSNSDGHTKKRLVVRRVVKSGQNR